MVLLLVARAPVRTDRIEHASERRDHVARVGLVVGMARESDADSYGGTRKISRVA
jgi:hypothetical protein